MTSQQVSWWSVHEHVQPLLDTAGSWPMLGTPEWCSLADDDPLKHAALLDAAQHWALRVETAQQARCDAAQMISQTEKWSDIANEIQSRTGVYIRRSA